mgnify:CR=1 FL=1
MNKLAKIILKPIRRTLRWNSAKFSLEVRLYNGILLSITILTLLLILPINLIIDRSSTDLLIIGLLGLSSFGFFIVSYHYQVHLLATTLFTFLAFLTFFWFAGAASEGPQPFFYLILFTFALILLRGFKRIIISFIIPSYLFVLFYIESKHPELIRYYATKEDQLTDLFGGVALAFMIIGLAIIIILNYFDAERRITEIQSRKLILRNLKLKDLAIKDGLTGLYNRRHLMDHLTREIAYAKRYKHPLAIILFDIDYFKKINDSFGHQVGDSILQQVGKSLLSNLRESDFAGRYGGEEFLIICRNTNVEGAFMVAKKLQHSIRHIRLPNRKECVEISGGIATHRSDTIASLIERADQLLYSAKGRGRNQILIDTWEKVN